MVHVDINNFIFLHAGIYTIRKCDYTYLCYDNADDLQVFTGCSKQSWMEDYNDDHFINILEATYCQIWLPVSFNFSSFAIKTVTEQLLASLPTNYRADVQLALTKGHACKKVRKLEKHSCPWLLTKCWDINTLPTAKKYMHLAISIIISIHSLNFQLGHQ